MYKHFGEGIIASLLGLDRADAKASAGVIRCYHSASKELIAGQGKLLSVQVRTVYLSVYKHFMEAIDAIDNGAPRQCQRCIYDLPLVFSKRSTSHMSTPACCSRGSSMRST